MPDVTLDQGEAKTITVTYSGSTDVSSATLSFTLKRQRGDTATLFTKTQADFDVSQASVGIISFGVTAANTSTAGNLAGEMKTQFSSTNIDKAFVTWRTREAVT